MRLIDADALLKEIEEWYDSVGGTTNPADWVVQNVLSSVMDTINESPTIEAEPVRHGQWIKNEYYKGWNCSECGAMAKHNCFGFCHCGAKMDAEDANVPTTQKED